MDQRCVFMPRLYCLLTHQQGPIHALHALTRSQRINDNATFQEPTFLGKLVLLTPFCEFPHFDISTSVGVL